MAFDRISPIGDERLDGLAAIIARTFGGGAVADYIPTYYKSAPTAKQLDKNISEVFAAMSGLRLARESKVNGNSR